MLIHFSLGRPGKCTDECRNQERHTGSHTLHSSSLHTGIVFSGESFPAWLVTT